MFKVGANLCFLVAGLKDSFTAAQRGAKRAGVSALRLSCKYNVAGSCGSPWLINPFGGVPASLEISTSVFYVMKCPIGAFQELLLKLQLHEALCHKLWMQEQIIGF